MQHCFILHSCYKSIDIMNQIGKVDLKRTSPLNLRKSTSVSVSSMGLEKPRVFDPRGQSNVDPRKLFCFDPCKVLTDRVIFIMPYYFLSFILRMLSPVSSIRCAVCTILSSTASATAGSPIASYQLSTGSWDASTIDFLSWRSSMMSSSMGRSFASSGTRKASSSMSS